MSVQNSSPNILEGYVAIDGPDNIKYVVPRFIISSLENDLAALGAKEDANVVTADLTRSLTDNEMLTLHAEVCALQKSLGISYQDAAHRLYMAEVAKLKVADGDRRYHAYMDRCMTKTLIKLEERHTFREDLRK
ncbi:hypothetical protein JR316_0008672 [Psilocybe cubensis]|uniref:Uncharacterized protein n=2 Tax=Psilocybe cubensis TaxID=181762 RepID=A0A8H7XYC0_PSICU|nr:hypothetical protein JR316_0008672 [Psilocybe cubensis]KAH9478219.1 hypothetical protein JR316_0008672 [Psilocybe cubensis]